MHFCALFVIKCALLSYFLIASDRITLSTSVNNKRKKIVFAPLNALGGIRYAEVQNVACTNSIFLYLSRRLCFYLGHNYFINRFLYPVACFPYYIFFLANFFVSSVSRQVMQNLYVATLLCQV